MERMSHAARKYIEDEQGRSLMGRFGPGYEQWFANLKANEKDVFEVIDKYLPLMLLIEDEQYETEARFKNDYFDDELLETKYDLVFHKKPLSVIRKLYNRLISYKNTQPYTAVIFAREINATVIHPGELDRPVILFTHEQITSPFLLSRYFSLCFPVEALKGETSLAGLVDGSVILFNFNNLPKQIRIEVVDFLDFSFRGEPGETRRGFFMNELIKEVGAPILHSMLLFIYSHEMGHIVLRHPLDAKGIPEKELCHQENMCDLHGSNQVIRFFELQKRNLFNLLGPAVYLNYLSLCEQFNESLSEDMTHPPALMRLANYKITVQNSLLTEEFNILKGYFETGDKIFSFYKDLMGGFYAGKTPDTFWPKH